MVPEEIGALAIVATALVGCWLLGRWLLTGNPGANPWDQETEERIHQSDAIPICPRCLEPQNSDVQCCEDCGLPMDPLISFSPYLYIFAFGDVFRTGTGGRFRVNWITAVGFILLPLVYVPILVIPIVIAPFYWFSLLRNLARNQTSQLPAMPAGRTGAG